jgi:hypothetical protein
VSKHLKIKHSILNNIFCDNKGAIINIGDQSFHKSNPESIYVPTNAQTYISIKKKVVKNLAKPYGQCDDESIKSNPSFYRAFDEKGKTYRQKDCLNIMTQRSTAKNCDCVLSGLITEDNTVKYCESNVFLECFNRVINQTKNDQFLKDCPFECNLIEYDFSISTSSASSSDYLKSFAEYNYGNKYSSENSSSAYAVNIFFSELTHARIVEVPNYTPISLISNIGGTLGLFLGMSLLSFIEIVDLIIQMILKSTRSNSNQIENY